MVGIALGTMLVGCGEMNMRVGMTSPIRIEGPMIVYEGSYISDELFERIEPGKTTEDWVIALLGEPTSRFTLDDGSEVWKWVYREQGYNTSILKLTGDEESPTLPQVLTFVRMDGNTVIEKWRG